MEPNLGNLRLNLIAKDDAKYIRCVKADDIANGIHAMPFRHIEFAKEYYSKINNNILVNKFEILCYFSKYRNHRIMKKVNEVLNNYPDKIKFSFTDEMLKHNELINLYLDKAKENNVNPDKYLDETTDEDDVKQCTSAWCLEQLPNNIKGKASDNIKIITDLDSTDWFILIERQFGPGKSQLAWAGGFLEKDETFKNAAIREGDEETEIIFNNSNKINYKQIITELPVISSYDWDPRAKFPYGMENGAVVTHYKFFNN